MIIFERFRTVRVNKCLEYRNNLIFVSVRYGVKRDGLSAWSKTLSGKSKTVKEKLGVVRGFGKYLNTLGYKSFLPTLPTVKSDYIPYIFSDGEVARIFHYADRLVPVKPQSCSSFFSLKVPMAMRILYSCGTRLGETMALRRRDVDFKNRTIFLEKTKFSKERVIPVHESLIAVMERYCLALGIMHQPDAFLFPGKKEGTHYTPRQMDAWFSEILKAAGIDQRERKPYERGACLHCFRHLFVLKSMQQLEAAGHSVDMNDLLLPTYLGHECLLGRFFTEYLPVSANASPNTIASYKCAFRLLFQYLNEETDIKTGRITFKVLDFDLLTKYFDWLVTTRKNSRSTAKQRLAALASFADYAESRSLEACYVFKASLKKIAKKSFRKVKGRQRSSFTRKELEVLFSLPDTTEKLGWRDLVLLTVMYSSGARAQEICDLTVKDVTHDEKGNAILTLIGKGEKARRVKITSDATRLLDKYIASRKVGMKLDEYIFPSQRNSHLSVAVEEIYEKYTQKAKAEHPEMFCQGPYTPHVMRHTAATHLIESGVPLAIVKNILGHTSIQTTQIYLDISQQTVDRSMEKWNEKWFSQNEPDETTLPKEKDGIPDFLK